jgi:hypothetical protein
VVTLADGRVCSAREVLVATGRRPRTADPAMIGYCMASPPTHGTDSSRRR